MIKVLCLVPYPTEGASNRVRVEQFVPYLASKGMACRVRPFVNSSFYKILYLPYRYLEKIFWFLVCTLNRFCDIVRALRYDIILIHREAYPFAGPFIETILYKIGKPIIFDFDDAIYLPNTSEHNIYIERFKKPGKVARIIGMSRWVITGNSHLEDYALRYNKNVTVIPSSVDTEKYCPAPAKAAKKDIVIGWIGSETTKRFLNELEDVFIEVANRHEGLVTFKVIGPPFRSLKLKNVVNKKWSLEDEISDLQSLDIGIMPMPDTEWTKGKCAFKALLYMACGIPVIVSPAGVNTQIVKDGWNGYLAKNATEWFEKMSLLIEDGILRTANGKNGRQTVIEKYSLNYTAPLFYRTLIDAYVSAKKNKKVSTHE